jgi:hypothetical protein
VAAKQEGVVKATRDMILLLFIGYDNVADIAPPMLMLLARRQPMEDSTPAEAVVVADDCRRSGRPLDDASNADDSSTLDSKTNMRNQIIDTVAFACCRWSWPWAAADGIDFILLAFNNATNVNDRRRRR